MKNTWKRFLSLVLCMCMVMALLPNVTMTAFAAESGEVTGLSNENIGLSYSGDRTDTWSANGTTVTGSIQSSSGCGTTHHSSTLTITNKRSIAATLSFDYAIDQQGGTIQVDGTAITAGGTFSKELVAGGMVNIYIKSNSTSKPTKITLSNLALSANIEATATFLPAENGSYTVDGKAVTEEFSNTQNAINAYKLVATPDAGYQFRGWYNVTTNQYVGTDTTISLNVEADCTLTALFAPETSGLFETGGQVFDKLNDAITYAQANSIEKITLQSKTATLNQNYTIPSGITLLVPFDAGKTLFTTTPTALAPGHQAATKKNEFSSLTLAEGVTLTLEGGLSVGGQYQSASGGSNSYMSGDYGQVWLNAGSNITVTSGGNLYAWGFVSGAGTVTVKSGGTVYEWYQILDFRGGTATMGIGNKVFPFNQYDIQNVESAMTLEQGATETAYAAVFASSRINPSAIPFIGDTGMFKIVSGSLTKMYDGATDRIIYTVNGEAEVNNLNLKLAGSSVSSKDYVLPITNNMTINLADGSKLTVNQTAALLPGVQANIAGGAELVVSNGVAIYAYDQDEWGGYCDTYSLKFKAVGYAPSKTYNRTEKDLVDAKVDVNGTLTAAGSIYTTQSGADICSSEDTGVYNQQGAPGKETKTYQYTQSGSSVTAHDIPITAAKLHNADGTYYETKTARAGDVINYVKGVWGGTPCAHKNTELRNAKEATCTEPGYTGDIYCKDCSEKISTGTPIPAKGHSWNEGKITTAPTCENAGVKTYTCTVCNATKTEAIDATGHTPVEVAEQPATCTEDGHTAGVKCSVCGATISGIEVIPATGHKPEIRNAVEATLTTPGYTGDIYCSVCNELLKQGTEIPKTGAHITWVIDGKVVAEEDYLKGTMPSFKGSTDKAPDENYRYTFTGWSPEVVVAEEDATYTAQYSATARVFYTITFNANGGEGSMEPQRFEVGVDTALNTNAFTREGYRFIGWNTAADGSGATYADEGAILELTGDMTLYAQWQFWNGWFTDVNGKQYYKNGELQKTGWTVIDGNTYYLDTETGYAATGIATLIPDGATKEARCVFDANGVFQSNVTGVYSVGNDTYWLNSGIIEEEAGLKRVVKENGEVNYYYFAVQKNLEEREGLTLSAAVKSTVLNGKDCWLHKTNGLALPEWGYYFDENGIILHDEDTSKNGILKDGEDLFYYVDGIRAPAGMIKIGDDYYYANSKGQLIVNQTYYCSRMNGLMKEGTYAFDAEGKLIPGATDKNGIVKDDDGVLRYYVNGKVTYVGLIEIDGDFYYVRSSGEVVTNCVYWITWTHGLKEAGYYTFDESGKLTGTPKNGIVEEDGVLHYYVNGKLTYAGLIKIGDDYYYVNSKCEVVHDCDYYITWTHDLKPQGKYHFDVDGKLTGAVAPLKNGIYEEDGSLYFYRNGERAYAGLIQINGDYYYVRSTCEVVHDRSYYVYWTHGLMPEGYYNFDSAGRMILDSETE